MDNISVIVVDDSSESRRRTVEGLRSRKVHIAGEAANGEECLELLKTKQADVIVSDLVMPVMDGMDLLEEIKKSGASPKVIIYSDVVSEYFITKTVQLGAYYFMSKSSSINSLMKRIVDAYNQNRDVNDKRPMAHYADEVVKHNVRPLEERIANIFIAVGIPAHIKGYQYLRDAILMSVEHPQIINGITKKLYPALAERYNTSAPRVERAIRHAIEVAWTRGRVDNINRLFGFKVYVANERPTNGEFIALVADKLMMEIKMAS